LLDALPWSLFALGLVALAWPTARRFRQARRGESALLDTRRRVLSAYRTRRDGRVYDPARNPEIALLAGREQRR
jgi:hypothetical protein